MVKSTTGLNSSKLLIALLIGSLSLQDYQECMGLKTDTSENGVDSRPEDISLLMTDVSQQIKAHSQSRTAVSQKQRHQMEQFLKMNQNQKLQVLNELKEGVELGAEALEASQWGFLKNIINIDKFFDSGVDSKESSKKEEKAQLKAASLSQQKKSKHSEVIEENTDEQETKEQATETQQVDQKKEEQSVDLILNPQEMKKKEQVKEAQPIQQESQNQQNSQKAQTEQGTDDNQSTNDTSEKQAQEIELERQAAEKRKQILLQKKAALAAKRQEIQKKKHEIEATAKERQEQIKKQKYADAQAATEKKRKMLQNKEHLLLEEVKQERQEATQGFEKAEQELKKQEEQSNERHKARDEQREKEFAARKEARRREAIKETQSAAQKRKQRKSTLESRRFIRQNKINFLSELVTPPDGQNKFFKTNDDVRWFTKPERFYIVQSQNTKKGPQVHLYKAFNVLSLRRAFLKFRGYIREDYIKDNNNEKQFGLIANNKLLFSTSAVKDFINDKNETFLASADSFQSTPSYKFTDDQIAKQFIGFGVQRGLIKMPKDGSDAESKQFKLLSINSKTMTSQVEQLGENKKKAIKSFKNKISQSSPSDQMLILVDPQGHAIKFSKKDKTSLQTDIAKFLQSKGDYQSPIMTDEEAGFQLLPAGQRPDNQEKSHQQKAQTPPTELKQVSDGNNKKQQQQVSADSFEDTGSKKSEIDQSAQVSQSVLPMHVRKIKHQNRKLRKEISEQEKRLKGDKAQSRAHKKKGAYSKYGKRIMTLLSQSYDGHGQKLNNTYSFGVLARDQKTKEYRQIAQVNSNNMKMAMNRLNQKIQQEIVDKRSGEMFMVYSNNGPLFCSVPTLAFQCREMTGFAITHGLIDPSKTIYSNQRPESNPHAYHLLQRAKGTPHVKISSLGTSDLQKAKKVFAQVSRNKKLIVALMDAQGNLVDRTVTNPKRKGEAKYGMVYSSIGLFQTLKTPGHYSQPIKNEKDAGLI